MQEHLSGRFQASAHSATRITGYSRSCDTCTLGAPAKVLPLRVCISCSSPFLATNSVLPPEICTGTAITREDIFTTLRDNGMLTLKAVQPESIDGDVAPPTPSKTSKRKRRPTGGRRTTSRANRRPSVSIESRVGSEGPGSPFAKSPRASFDTTASGPKTSDADKDDEENVIVPHPSQYTITWDAELVSGKLDKWAAKGYLVIRPENLEWSPYLLSRTGEDTEMSGRPEEMLGTEVPTHSLMVPTPTPAAPAKGKMPLGPSKLSKVVTLPAASLMPPIALTNNHNSAGALGDFATLALAHEKQSQEQADHALAALLAEEERVAMDALSSPRRTRSAASVTPSGLGHVAGPSAAEHQSSPTPVVPSKRKRATQPRTRESAGAVSVPSGWAAAEEEGQEDEEGKRATRAKRARTSMGVSSVPAGIVEEPQPSRRRPRAPKPAANTAHGTMASIDTYFPPIQSASSSSVRRNRKRTSAAAAATTPEESTELLHDAELDAVPLLRRSSEPLGTSVDSITGETQTPPSGDADTSHPVVIVTADQQLSGTPFVIPVAEKRAAVELHGALADVRVNANGDLNQVEDEDEDAEGEDDPDA